LISSTSFLISSRISLATSAPLMSFAGMLSSF
jgi:hypothetical protein